MATRDGQPSQCQLGQTQSNFAVTRYAKPCVVLCQVDLLTEIWHDYHRETLCRPIPRRLPEPPDQRQMLKAEIKFFVQSIQEKAKAHGRFVVGL